MHSLRQRRPQKSPGFQSRLTLMRSCLFEDMFTQGHHWIISLSCTLVPLQGNNTPREPRDMSLSLLNPLWWFDKMRTNTQSTPWRSLYMLTWTLNIVMWEIMADTTDETKYCHWAFKEWDKWLFFRLFNTLRLTLAKLSMCGIILIGYM